MAVTLKQAGFVLLLVGAAYTTFRKPGHSPDRALSVPPSERINELYYLQRTARFRWSVLAESDSARAFAVRASGQSAAFPIVELDGRPVADSADDTNKLIRNIWRRISAPDPRVKTFVLMYDRARYRWSGYNGTVIEQSDSNATCVAVAEAQLSKGHRPLDVYPEALKFALAPCALYATFGLPGQGVTAWLRAGRYTVAQSMDWLVPPRARRERSSPWIMWANTDAEREWHPSILYRAFTEFNDAVVRTPPYNYGQLGLRCIIGDVDSCAAEFRWTSASADSSIIPDDVARSLWYQRPDTVTMATLRPPAPTMLSDLISEFGQERFAKFWASSLPIEDAFRSAFGETPGAWTARWAKREWQATERARFEWADIALGTPFRLSWLPIVAIWSALALLVTTWVAQRRRIV